MKFFVLKSSFSSLRSSIQVTEMFDYLNSLVTRSNVNAHRLFHRIMLFQFDLLYYVKNVRNFHNFKLVSTRPRWKWRVASVRRWRWLLIRWLADLATKWLSCARKYTRSKNSNTQVKLARFIHFMRFKENPLPWLVNSTLNFIRKIIVIFLVKFNVEFTRKAMYFPILEVTNG